MTNIIAEDINRIINDETLESLWAGLSNKVVLVTGAAGMVASYFVHTLMKLGDVKVIANVRRREKAEKFASYFENPNFKLLVQNICDPLRLEGEIDYIIHAASPTSKLIQDDPVSVIKANIMGTTNLLEVLKTQNHGKMIFVSTVEIYGKTTRSAGILESDAGICDLEAQTACYSESKRMGEVICKSYYRQYAVDATIGRISSTYGPGDEEKQTARSEFIRNAMNGNDIILKSNGALTRDYQYISDTVTAFFYLLFYGEAGESYNISNPHEIASIYELAKLAASCADKDIRVLRLEHDDDMDNGRFIVLNNDKLKRLVEYRWGKGGYAQKVRLQDGLLRTYEYRINVERK
jgi:nucleoside-diphosphate-sugar epimerase